MPVILIRIIPFPAPLFQPEMSFIETRNSVHRCTGACLTAVRRMMYDDVTFIGPDGIGEIKFLRENFHSLMSNVTATCSPLYFIACISHSCVSTPYAVVHTLETARDKKEKEWVVC